MNTHPITPDQLETVKSRLRMDYADFGGVQPGFMELPDIRLWNLRRAIPGHPKHSTVSEQTLDVWLFADGR